MKKITLLVLLLLLLSACNRSTKDVSEPPPLAGESTEMKLQNEEASVRELTADEKDQIQRLLSGANLETSPTKSSLPVDEILSGGPPKDGIPAINNPQFDTVEEANEWLNDEGLGMLFSIEDDVRYYPYAISYWHEIINDTVGEKNVSITFCPLCGSAIVFDRGDDVFGVSGLLWSSNLLMYDQASETLWSQILGEAVLGERTGEALEILPSDTITFAEFKTSHPDGLILNRDTGHRRAYGQSPYGNYEDIDNDDLFFPVEGLESEAAKAFARKELFVASAALPNRTIGFMRADLLEAGEASLTVDGITIEASASEDGSVELTRTDTNEPLPHFVTMWFSLFAHLGGEEKVVVWP